MKISRSIRLKASLRGTPKHIDLLPQYQNLGLKRSSRPETIHEHPPDQSARVQHHATASPDSRSTTSRIWFAAGTASFRSLAAPFFNAKLCTQKRSMAALGKLFDERRGPHSISCRFE